MSMYTATLPGRELAQRFQSLGDMTGKSLDEISAVVGPPNARAAMPNNTVLYQWQATGYHIAILFDVGNTFAGISSEHSSIQNPDANDVASGIGTLIGVVIVVLAALLALASHC